MNSQQCSEWPPPVVRWPASWTTSSARDYPSAGCHSPTKQLTSSIHCKVTALAILSSLLSQRSGLPVSAVYKPHLPPPFQFREGALVLSFHILRLFNLNVVVTGISQGNLFFSVVVNLFFASVLQKEFKILTKTKCMVT